ncbi:transposable element Tcb1 transposase [Trichonephila clavipes]|nr:transposable element Tcb1 transposase [Trichonephila clavipes]
MRLWHQFQTSSTVIRKFSQFRNKAITPARDRHLALNARWHRRTTAPQLACDHAVSSGRKITRQTVYRRLAKTGLYALRPVVCVPSTASNKKDELSWNRKHQSRTLREWGCILFTNESRFTRQSNSYRVFIWRESGVALVPLT